MNKWTILGLLLAGLAVFYAVYTQRERFVPEFLDQGNVKKTIDTSRSSYAQETNHFKMTRPPPEPIPGTETPFRVNMYNSFTQ
jgi:hypothetical protein